MSELTPPVVNPGLYAPRPTVSNAPGLTPLGGFALVFGAAAVVALGTLMSGHSLPGVAAIGAPTPAATHKVASQPHVRVPPRTAPTAIPTATPTIAAVMPADGQIHEVVEQETHRLVAQVKDAQQSDDEATLTELAQSTQQVTTPSGVPVWERVMFLGSGENRESAIFLVVATSQDSTGENYTFAYNSRTGEYSVGDPTLQSPF